MFTLLYTLLRSADEELFPVGPSGEYVGEALEVV